MSSSPRGLKDVAMGCCGTVATGIAVVSSGFEMVIVLDDGMWFLVALRGKR